MIRIANWIFDHGAASVAKRCGRSAASVMALTLALGCGAIWAESAKPEAAAGAPIQVKAADIAGRWTGAHHSYGAIRAKCEGGPCTMTLDITACGSSWCGVLVKQDGSCGGSALKVETGEGKEAWLRFNGRLELDSKAASYVIQATVWRAEDTQQAPQLEIIGDTGTELMFMRRSFPFQAHMARTGEAQCTTDKATS